MELAPGTRVRCAYRDAHVGTLLAIDDPRAWVGSIAFPGGEPTPELVRAHVARCRARGDLDGSRLPVAWDFGKVYWDRQLSPIQITRYGTLEIAAGGFEGAQRVDRWVPHDGGRPVMERTFVTSGSDLSERFRAAYADDPGHGRYDSRCSCCYLGFSHSVDVHARGTRDAKAG